MCAHADDDGPVNVMGDAMVRIGPALAAVVVALALVAVIVHYAATTGYGRGTAIAAVRACVQLAALATVLTIVIQHIWASVLFVVVMACVAARTSAGRITQGSNMISSTFFCLLPVAAATVLIVTLVLVIGVLPATGLAVIPTAGIMFGGAMNTTSLAGRRAHDELTTRQGEVQAALALGMLPRDARLEICGPAAYTALVPGIDQTRSVGLVAIPGAFVGMILGGASTTAAAIMQLFVLISLLAVSAIAAVITTEMIAREAI